MNNDNEIMKEFNETFGNKLEPQVEPYRATQNQNVVSSNINNMNVQNNNIDNVNMPNFINHESPVNVVPEVNTLANSGNIVNNVSPVASINTPAVTPVDNPQQLYNTSNYIYHIFLRLLSQFPNRLYAKCQYYS